MGKAVTAANDPPSLEHSAGGRGHVTVGRHQVRTNRLAKPRF